MNDDMFSIKGTLRDVFSHLDNRDDALGRIVSLEIGSAARGKPDFFQCFLMISSKPAAQIVLSGRTLTVLSTL